MTKRLFITGTGTELGKTELTVRLVRAARAADRRVHAVKPIISGFALDDPASDSRRIADALGLTWSRAMADRLSPIRFDPPISPDMAARRAGRKIDLEELVKWCKGQNGDPLLIEGVGGAFVPLNGQVLVADWITAQGAPAILVAGSYLGTLSHTFSALEALDRRGVSVAAIIVSQSAEEPVPLEETLAAMAAHTDVPLGCLPRRTETPSDLVKLLDLAA